MARRRKQDSITPDDVVDVLSRMPFWVGPLAVSIVYTAMRWGVPWLLEDRQLEDTLKKTETMNMAAPVLRNAVAGGSRIAAPYFALILALLWVVAELVKRFSPARRRQSERGAKDARREA